jgi:hypothetical protein
MPSSALCRGRHQGTFERLRHCTLPESLTIALMPAQSDHAEVWQEPGREILARLSLPLELQIELTKPSGKEGVPRSV